MKKIREEINHRGESLFKYISKSLKCWEKDYSQDFLKA